MFVPHSAGHLVTETLQMAFSGQRPRTVTTCFHVRNIARRLWHRWQLCMATKALARASAVMNSSRLVTDPNAPISRCSALHGPREFAAMWTTSHRVGYRTDANFAFDIYVYCRRR